MRFLLGLTILAFGVLQAASAQANQRITFDYFPRGAMANAVRAAWAQEAKYQAYYEASLMVPDFALAQYDINGDGRPEVFARHTDELSGFCWSPELDGNKCLMVVYANTERGLIKIGEIPVADEVIIGSRSSKGVRDLIITQPEGTRIRYIWNGQAYEAQ